MPSDSDRLLIQQIRDGDPRAWQTLIARYEGRLIAYVQRRIRDRSASEDVVQETFVGFLNSLPNFDDKRELQTYLFTIASHKLTDHLRKAGRHPLKSLAEGNEELLDQQTDHNPTASSRVRTDERQELESQALTRSTPPTLAIARSVAVLSLVMIICSRTSRSVGCSPGSL